MKRTLMILACVLLCGCKSADKLPDLKASAETAEATVGECFRQITDANLRAVVQFDLEGTAPGTPGTNQARKVAQAIADYAGTPIEPLSDWAETDALLTELIKANATFEAARREYQNELQSRAKQLTEWKARAQTAEADLAIAEALNERLNPVVLAGYYAVLAAIGAITAAFVFYYGTIRRLTSPVSGTIGAFAAGIIGAVAGIVWWIHGKDLIIWGMALTCVLLAVAVVLYLKKREYWERMIAAFQTWRASLPADEREKLDAAMNALQPSWLKDAIRTTKNVLGLRSASG